MLRFGWIGRVSCWTIERLVLYGEDVAEAVVKGVEGPRKGPCVAASGGNWDCRWLDPDGCR